MSENTDTLQSRRRVLLVEDEAVTALALEQILLGGGYEVCGIASTAAGAKSLAQSTRPDVAVVDVRLRDGVTGHSAAMEIQTRLKIPVVLTSGHFDEKHAREAGLAGFLRKPFSEPQLLQVIDAVLGLVYANRAVPPLVPGVMVPNYFVPDPSRN